MVNSKTLVSSYGSGLNGKPHSKRSGPSGENQRMPEAVRGAQAEEAGSPWKQGSVTAKVRARGRVAIDLLEVPRVAGVGEDDAADADLVDDGELELEVLVVAQVAADVRAVGDGRRVGVERLVERQARADRAQAEAAHVEDAAEEEAREDGHALRRWARDEPAVHVELDDEPLARADSRSGRSRAWRRNWLSLPSALGARARSSPAGRRRSSGRAGCCACRR